MKADTAILNRLDAPTKAPSWPVGADGQCHLNLNAFIIHMLEQDIWIHGQLRLTLKWILINHIIILRSILLSGNRPPAKIPVPLPPSRLKKNDEVSYTVLLWLNNLLIAWIFEVNIVGVGELIFSYYNWSILMTNFMITRNFLLFLVFCCSEMLNVSDLIICLKFKGLVFVTYKWVYICWWNQSSWILVLFLMQFCHLTIFCWFDFWVDIKSAPTAESWGTYSWSGYWSSSNCSYES